MSVMLGLEAHFVLTTVEAIETIEEHVGSVMEQLVELTHSGCGIADPAVTLDLSDKTVVVEVVALGEDFDSAVATADSCIRTAIHAAGGSTPSWGMQKKSQRAELVPA